MARLHLVRHGETDWNVEKRYQGSKDIPLNERGRLQAQEVAENLKSLSLAGIYSSTLKRAIETAEIIKGARPHLVEKFDELREAYYGSLEGMTFDEVKKEWPHVHEKQQAFFATKTDLIPNSEKLHCRLVPDMESGYEVAQRAIGALDTIAKRHPNEDILVVTHGGVIRALLVYLADYDWSTVHIQNGQLVTFVHENGAFNVVEKFS